MRIFVRCFMIALLLLVSAGTSLSKGHADLIVIKKGSDPPVEIRQPELLSQCDPWSGQFADWKRGVTSAPVNLTNAYQVFFLMKWPGRSSNYDRGQLRMIYEFSYVPGTDVDPGYVYLPARGEEFHEINISTIIRDGLDGHWIHASRSWAELFSRTSISRS